MYKKILQHNVAAIFLLILLLIVAEYMHYQRDPHNSLVGSAVKKYYFAPALDGVADYYDAYTTSLQTDEYMMYVWLSPEQAQEKARAFDSDPFDRLLENDQLVEDYVITRRVDSGEEVIDLYLREGVEAPLYDVGVQYREMMIDPADEIITKALYCDVTGYDDFDRELLGLLRDNDGGYGDTHYLLGLLLIEKLGCVSQEDISEDKKKVIDTIIAAEQNDEHFSDLFSERIVLLYWAGQGGVVDVDWIEKIVQNVQEDNGWRDIGEQKSDPHTTGLAALAIKYFIEGDMVQDVLLR